MSENQLFCFAEMFGREYADSYQQKSFRVFNVQVTEKEYLEIREKVWKLNLGERNYQEKKQELLEIPYFNAEIFEKITGLKI
jgi:hypothetical protein